MDNQQAAAATLAKFEQMREKMYRHFLDYVGRSVCTWDDMYVLLRESFTRSMTCHCEMHITYALVLNRAFVVAMEELPAEGDIKKIFEHIAYNLFHPAKDGKSSMLGALSPSNASPSTAEGMEAMTEVLGKFRFASIKEGDEEEQEAAVAEVGPVPPTMH